MVAWLRGCCVYFSVYVCVPVCMKYQLDQYIYVYVYMGEGVGCVCWGMNGPYFGEGNIDIGGCQLLVHEIGIFA